MTFQRLGLSERQYAAHAGISRGAVQKARQSGRLVLHGDGSIDAVAAKAQSRQVADQLRPRAKQLVTIMDKAEQDVLAHMTFPTEHHVKLHLTDEMDKRNRVVDILPNKVAVTHLAGTILLQQNNEWAVQRARYMRLETLPTIGNVALIRLPDTATRPNLPTSRCPRNCYTIPRDTIFTSAFPREDHLQPRSFPAPRTSRSRLVSWGSAAKSLERLDDGRPMAHCRENQPQREEGNADIESAAR
jgi:hypothetical protein